MMTEKFLHYLWKMKLLNPEALQTVEGENIAIIKAGIHNRDAGPDFLDARLRIGNTAWAGTVEMHVNSGEWNRHHHQQDAAYNNVILHVVYERDQDVFHADGTPVISCEVKGKFDAALFNNYQALMQSQSWIPCEKNLRQVNDFTISQWIQRLMITRLEEKIQPIMLALAQNENNWEETCYRFIASAFGARVNAEPFDMLARLVPLKVLARHKGNLLQLEALLFGAAGFLEEDFSEDYPGRLKKEFSFLKMKYGIAPMKAYLWKFLRLRPANFPTIRIAQFAQLIYSSVHLFSKILEAENAERLAALFRSRPSAYWLTHYRFGKSSPHKAKPLGRDAIDLLIINTLVPLIFVYGKLRDEEFYQTHALKLLTQMPAEKNSIISHWKSSGIHAANAAESQALLQLKNRYCSHFRCLDCAIGHALLTKVKR